MSDATKDKQVSTHLFVNKQHLTKLYKDCTDFTVHPIEIENRPYVMLIYLNTLVDQKEINELLLTPIMSLLHHSNNEPIESLKQAISQNQLAITPIQHATSINDINEAIVNGNVALFIDGKNEALLIDLINIEERAIEEPSTELSIRGPKDGFNESLQTNLNIIRNRVRTNRLKLLKYKIGTITKTDVVIAYIDGMVCDKLLIEVTDRLKKIKVNKIITSELIEELIEDDPFTPFPLIQNTERPDTATGNLFEGRIIIIVDHTPFVLIVPATFWNGFEATSDVYDRFIYVTFIRLLRMALLSIALFLPAIYVALTTFHPKLIPTALLISIASARENVPFPAIIEAFIMELVFEGLREAGLRLPKAVGQAISIVGAIVIGQAAVEAGIVSTAMVIVVAATGISSFAIPKYNTEIAIRLIRFPILLLSGMFGLFGVVIGFIGLLIHLVSRRSFNVPYFKPVAPQIPVDLKHILIKTPIWAKSIRSLLRFNRM